MKQLIPGILVLNCWLLAAAAEPVTMKADRFDLADVRVTGGPFKTAQDLDGQYLLSLEPDRLLAMFRVTAGLSNTATAYGGWEKPGVELRGHSMGHYLSACALMYASTGDARFKERTDYIVATLATCQSNMPAKGYNAGYLSAFPESFFDRVDAGRSVWAPWYTMHKIMAGLFDVYVHTGNPQALEVLNKLADWVKFRVDRLSPAQMQASLRTEHGGMNEVLANLSAITHNPEDLRLAQAFNHQSVFEPLSHCEDRLDGLHANTQIPKMTGAAREYELTGNEVYREIASCFWTRVALSRSYALGGDSDDEHFFRITDFAKHLSPVTAETCNTYNMLKLSEHLFSWEPSASTMDFYERGLYNQILASQDPEHGMFAYFLSMKPGHFKTYSTPDDSFWCCVGTGMENHAKYGEMIFSRNTNALYVNLFIPAELKWRDREFTIVQETKFPEENTSQLRFKGRRPQTFALKIREPGWAAGGMSLKLNGSKIKPDRDGSGYVTLQREWHDGDSVMVTLPMTIRTEFLPGTSNIVAFFYGPILLAGEMGKEGLPNDLQYARDQKDYVWVPSPAAPVLVGGVETLKDHLRPVRGKSLTFVSHDIAKPKDLTLIPYYQLHHERYTVYWPVYSAQEWKVEAAQREKADNERKAFEARVIDQLTPGNPQSDRDHNFREEGTETGEFQGRKWRQARDGSALTWTFKAISNKPLILRCTFWGSELRRADFEILVNGSVVGQHVPDPEARNGFVDADFPIPSSAIASKSSIQITLRPKAGNSTGRVFQCSLLKESSTK